MKQRLTITNLLLEAKAFCLMESQHSTKDLFGVTDGKAIGTYIEHKFQKHLTERYDLAVGSSAKGIDLPSVDVDIKVTSFKQPQSSCPFKDAKQKIFGLGYNLLVFVYDKVDDAMLQTTRLTFVNCSFVAKERTADYTTTFRLRELVNDKANEEDIVAYLNDKNIPADEITLYQIAEEILDNPPKQGYLTISNALQWRLQYQRVISLPEEVDGINRII